jgi:hypothetical protein
MKSHSWTGHNPGNVPATEITHRSGVHITTPGNAPPDASHGAGIQSGIWLSFQQNHLTGALTNLFDMENI